jgi:dipeptidase D
MTEAFKGLEPTILWDTFKAITQIPRPSKKEEKIIKYMEEWAKEKGFELIKDAVENVLIRVPATPGKESSPIVVLQGHLDMVCEKNNETEFDFDNLPINVYKDGDWLKAKGTTLGADNGIGVAMSMAAAIDPEVTHGPLELLFTIDEETGLTGAQFLKPGFLNGRILINIDSEEEGVLFVGCAGGGDALIQWAGDKSSVEGLSGYKISVNGLIGGHSGLVIHENRGNALKLLTNTLDAIPGNWGLVDLTGGDKHNAIPRQSEALVASSLSLEGLQAVADKVLAGFAQEFGNIEPDTSITVEAAPVAEKAWVGKELERVINLILAIPHGVQTMSRDLKGLVETSTNLARILVVDGKVEILTSSRSSVSPALENLRRQIKAVAELSGATINLHESYPGWQPDMKSKLLTHCVTVHEQLLGKKPEINAIHAGLECGIIGEPYGDMEMISMGPTMHDVHSPDERLSISSTNNVYKYLKAVLAAF